VHALIEPAPTRLDLTFTLFGVHVRVSAWFWIVPILIGGSTALALGLPYLLVTMGCFFLSVLLHEFGHVIAGQWFGQNGYIVLNALGGVAIGCADAFERWQRIVVYAAGPGIQVLAAIVLWGTDHLFIRSFSNAQYDYPLIFYALTALIWINIGLAVFNILPLFPPLDGFHICRELLGAFRGGQRAPWEQDPNWWKRGMGGSDYAVPPEAYMRGSYSNRLPLLILFAVTGLVFGWVMLRDIRISTANDLMEAFKEDPQGAMRKYGHRRITFKAILRRRPGEDFLYQDDHFGNALVYFGTDDSNEWIFCMVAYDKPLGTLNEGSLYRVSGEVYHFEERRNLFLHRCSLRLIREATSE
jgi:Zn-dependent protease